MGNGYRQKSRQTFEDDFKHGDWVEGSGKKAAEHYAEGLRKGLRARNQGTDMFAVNVIQVGRHTWAAVLWERTPKKKGK